MKLRNPFTIHPRHAMRLVNVLLIEDDRAEARLLQELLRSANSSSPQPLNLVHVQRLQDAIARLETDRFDLAFLDLTLPDSHGLASLQVLANRYPKLPIVVLTNTNDDNLALEAVRQGAQDYLVKRSINSEVIIRSLRYAIERKQITEALREANEALEQRVQERTQELATTNTQLTEEIQERQRIQERFEQAQQAAKIGTFEWNIVTDRITWTAELEALYDLEPGTFGGTLQDWLNLIEADDRDRVEQKLWEAVGLQRSFEIEFRVSNNVSNRLQNDRWMSARGRVFYDDRAKPLRMLGINADITEKKQLHAQFLHAQRMESIGTLASGIAHDLNNVLTPILAVSQLLPLKLPNLDDHHRRLIELLETSSRRGADIVQQILSFARGIEGKPLPIDLTELIQEVETMLQQTVTKSIAIQMQLEQPLWKVLADATQLQQVVMNLCVNARDAMPTGGTLKISAENCTIDETASDQTNPPAGSYVIVSVTDTGTGIAPELIDRIFDPFFTTKEVGKGTGLGLSAVAGIVKSHGGFLQVQSHRGTGSQFQVFLPAIPTTIAPPLSPIELPLGNDELVLVVDDEATICEVTQQTLELYRYRALVANSGQDAIALYRQHQPNMVLLDVMMPDMDGIKTIAALRQLNPNVLIIAMTGQASIEALNQVRDLNVQALLRKPFTTQQLLEMLHTEDAVLTTHFDHES